MQQESKTTNTEIDPTSFRKDTSQLKQQSSQANGRADAPGGVINSQTTRTARSRCKPSFHAGIAFALAEVWRTHHEDIIIRDVLHGSGITVADLKAGGGDPYDTDAVDEAMGSFENG